VVMCVVLLNGVSDEISQLNVCVCLFSIVVFYFC
jgi:hypothetical protein